MIGRQHEGKQKQCLPCRGRAEGGWAAEGEGQTEETGGHRMDVRDVRGGGGGSGLRGSSALGTSAAVGVEIRRWGAEGNLGTSSGAE
jgi:hypothetical protein